MKKIAFKPHETRGQDIIKILEGMGGVNKYNLDGSKGIIAIDNLSTKSISNDWDYRGLIMNGWKVYTLEEYENLKKSAQDFAVDILTKEKDCYFDDCDVEIVAEAYIAGYKDAINEKDAINMDCIITHMPMEPAPKKYNSRYKVGDKVKIKDIKWYKRNHDIYGYVIINNKCIMNFSDREMCGKIFTIKEVIGDDFYIFVETGYDGWLEEIIECKVEE